MNLIFVLFYICSMVVLFVYERMVPGKYKELESVAKCRTSKKPKTIADRFTSCALNDIAIHSTALYYAGKLKTPVLVHDRYDTLIGKIKAVGRMMEQAGNNREDILPVIDFNGMRPSVSKTDKSHTPTSSELRNYENLNAALDYLRGIGGPRPIVLYNIAPLAKYQLQTLTKLMKRYNAIGIHYNAKNVKIKKAIKLYPKDRYEQFIYHRSGNRPVNYGELIKDRLLSLLARYSDNTRVKYNDKLKNYIDKSTIYSFNISASNKIDKDNIKHIPVQIPALYVGGALKDY